MMVSEKFSRDNRKDFFESSTYPITRAGRKKSRETMESQLRDCFRIERFIQTLKIRGNIVLEMSDLIWD